MPWLVWSLISSQCCCLPPFHPQLLYQQHLLFCSIPTSSSGKSQPQTKHLLALSLGCSPPVNAPFLPLSPPLSVNPYLCLLLCSLPGPQPSLNFPKAFVLPFPSSGCAPHSYQAAPYSASTFQNRVYQPCWSNSDWSQKKLLPGRKSSRAVIRRNPGQGEGVGKETI